MRVTPKEAKAKLPTTAKASKGDLRPDPVVRREIPEKKKKENRQENLGAVRRGAHFTIHHDL